MIVGILDVSAGSQTNADDGEWTDSTVEVEVVSVRNDPMTPLPRHNSDDSSDSNRSSACVILATRRYLYR